ncbi:MAG: hypothetical protein JWQ36_618 [Enterovirga sp.]|nr:hypothetical protein [Enterovirga sp.]
MIKVGVGGWTFAPWCGTFYPKGLPHARELEHASRHLTAIEINGTFYRTQSPESFRKWAAETPDGFVFSVKGHRFVTNRKRLAEAGPAVESFLGSGVLELGDKLGPLLWQLAPTKRFEPEDIDAFLRLLPKERGGRLLRHALEVRHESFVTPDLVEVLRRHAVPAVFAESEDYPAIPDPVGDFVYARLQRSREAEPEGYPPAELDLWAERARQWERGEMPAALPSLSAERPETRPRDVFVFFIAGDKVKNPLAAQALLRRL